jgi:hypothetical protein
LLNELTELRWNPVSASELNVGDVFRRLSRKRFGRGVLSLKVPRETIQAVLSRHHNVGGRGIDSQHFILLIAQRRKPTREPARQFCVASERLMLCARECDTAPSVCQYTRAREGDTYAQNNSIQKGFLP